MARWTELFTGVDVDTSVEESNLRNIVVVVAVAVVVVVVVRNDNLRNDNGVRQLYFI
jgi:hypothetical protein